MSQTELFSAPSVPPTPDRQAGLERLKAFTPLMGRRYAAQRNFDFGPEDRSNISVLSAHVRHRLVLESELAQAALNAHGLQAAEKFIQEVCWRTYWKGWLELRPSRWSEYKSELSQALNVLSEDDALRRRYETACEGRTGLDCFDAWVSELMQTGYLHNHARMWFASIWIYTLELPWVLGADLFLRHLIDGDPASNTLSWRWVGGLQTAGKTYLARASNIEKYTGGRFSPDAGTLAHEAPPLDPALQHPAPQTLAAEETPDPDAPSLLWLHEEDLHAESWAAEKRDVRAVVYQAGPLARGELALGACSSRFTQQALEDGARRAGAHFGRTAQACAHIEDVIDAARSVGAKQILTQRPAVGPGLDRMPPYRAKLAQADLTLIEMRRSWDVAFHPYATKGFFKFKSAIPTVFDQLSLN
jgi:deoxyribodipyrimidine photo-lyase